jgi:hypothetical protein
MQFCSDGIDKESLWLSISSHQIGPKNARYSFVKRLASESSWSIRFAEKALHEYKRFIYLLCVSSHPVTPSAQVDQVWHLHLLYTHDYWDDFAPKLNKRPHHCPTEGGSFENQKFKDYYQKTLDSYVYFFKEKPPLEFWPVPSIRFQSLEYLNRVDLDHFVVLPRNHLKILAIMLALSLLFYGYISFSFDSLL